MDIQYNVRDIVDIQYNVRDIVDIQYNVRDTVDIQYNVRDTVDIQYNRPYRFTIIEDYKVRDGLEQTTSETFRRTGTHKSRAPGSSGVYILYSGA